MSAIQASDGPGCKPRITRGSAARTRPGSQKPEDRDVNGATSPSGSGRCARSSWGQDGFRQALTCREEAGGAASKIPEDPRSRQRRCGASRPRSRRPWCTRWRRCWSWRRDKARSCARYRRAWRRRRRSGARPHRSSRARQRGMRCRRARCRRSPAARAARKTGRCRCRPCCNRSRPRRTRCCIGRSGCRRHHCRRGAH